MRCRVPEPISSQTDAKYGSMSDRGRHMATFRFASLLTLAMVLTTRTLKRRAPRSRYLTRMEIQH